ncbi:hypothetical protein SAY86_023320 [Trapa natans]|uniref:Membrane protein of ER body-like protein n=2 Tax=Trapa natans TaxID=22666 RepID=A0AAN7LUU2_TRANT|nr:hypothetical protein SAY86_023320 [Trapa natans]
MEHMLNELGYLPNVEEEEREAEEHGEVLHRRRPLLITKNIESFTVSADLVSQGVSMADSSVAQEPEPEFEHGEAKPHDGNGSGGFGIIGDHLVRNVDWEEELQQRDSFEEVQESTRMQQEEERGDAGFIAYKNVLIREEYDLTAEKSETQETVSIKPPSDEPENLPGLQLPSPRKPYQDETAVNFIEVNPGETEYNVAEVLEKQNTHDLFCPNCRSCITRKVILRRRRLRVPRFPSDARGRRVIVTTEEEEIGSITEAGDQSPDVLETAPVSEAPTDANEDRRDDREPNVFRCLSCFTFFIPTGDGFRIFGIFEKRREADRLQEGQEFPAAAVATDNSLFSLLQWKRKAAVIEDRGEPPVIGQSLEDTKIRPKPLEVIAYPTSIAAVVDQSIISIDRTPVKETEKDLPVEIKNTMATEVLSSLESQSSTDESKVAVADSLNLLMLKNDAAKEPEEPIKESTGDIIVRAKTTSASQTTPTSNTMIDLENPPEVDTQPYVGQAKTSEILEARDFDILKSIAYGGLVESIASLGVVSSAAGGGAATLNTFALALANLITGLFILIHNLRELKNEQSSSNRTQSDMEEDRYYQQLGRRGKFSLHATLAVVSYLVFGLVAPSTYGFSFRISDNRDYKLAVVAAASLVCILLLSIAKAHVCSKSYMKTISYYIVMGFAASGISFLVGELVDKLLEQLKLFESGSSSSSVSGFLRGVSLSRSGWVSN